MKKLFISITIVFCVMISLTATASTNFFKDNQTKHYSISKKEYNKIEVGQAKSQKFEEIYNESNVTAINPFGICFVNISKPYLVEGMDGTLYVTYDITVNCYGIPGNDVIIVTQEQRP